MLLYYLLTTVHVLVCIILILVVLLQSGKGADLAGAFGGGATQTAFGSRGPASFLSKMTTVAAVVFMLTSIGLSTVSRKVESKSILDSTTGRPRPAAKVPATQPPAPAPTLDQIRKRQEELQAKQQGQQQAQPATKVEQGTSKTAPTGSTATSPAKPTETRQPAKESKAPSKE
jgi:preprotein translocase subunit SecG